mmetsp:Transcript_41527/g.56632  ORF Transcript_41527/g.56632 Transcript_41527/m.56632 type:complete len:100 (+) Transcript_41527:418-717(+)
MGSTTTGTAILPARSGHTANPMIPSVGQGRTASICTVTAHGTTSPAVFAQMRTSLSSGMTSLNKLFVKSESMPDQMTSELYKTVVHQLDLKTSASYGWY